MMIKKVLFVFASVVAYCNVASASPSLKECEGSIDTRISIQDFKSCEAFTKNKKMTARQKAQIYLQLGITAHVDQYNTRSTIFKDGLGMHFKYWEKAIAADKTFVEPYLILAATHASLNQMDLKAKFLKEGQIAFPNDPRLDSEVALLDASPDRASAIQEMCGRATANGVADSSVFYNCGQAYWYANLKAESEASFRKAAFGFPDGQSSRYGLIAPYIGASTYAENLKADGKYIQAADFLEEYLAFKHWLGVNYSDLELLGDLFLKVGKPAKAANAFEKAARQTDDEMQYSLRLRQIIGLAASGNNDEAQSVSAQLYRNATKKQILQLQLKLKNATQKELVITGKFDDATKTALMECLLDSECFMISSGQLL